MKRYQETVETNQREELWVRATATTLTVSSLCPQELFSKQKGYLDDELDFRKQSLDKAHKVRKTPELTVTSLLSCLCRVCGLFCLGQCCSWSAPRTKKAEF